MTENRPDTITMILPPFSNRVRPPLSLLSLGAVHYCTALKLAGGSLPKKHDLSNQALQPLQKVLEGVEAA